MIDNNVGISLIAQNNFPEVNFQRITEILPLVDITPNHLNNPPQVEVLSLQAIFFGCDLANASLVQSDEQFQLLANIFHEQLKRFQALKIKSIIFGSPGTRMKPSVLKGTLHQRCELLFQLARNHGIKLYLEALPATNCGFINTHHELFELHELLNFGGIHVDFATVHANNEFDWVKTAETNVIDRFHISNPNYSWDFSSFPKILDCSKNLVQFGVKGTFEILDFKNFDFEKFQQIVTQIKN